MSRISVQVDRLVDERSLLPTTLSAASEPDRDRAGRGKGDRGWKVIGLAIALISYWMLLLLTALGAHAQAVFATPQTIGSAAGPQQVIVTSPVGGVVSQVKVLTMGIGGLDFASVSHAASCDTVGSIAAGGSCTEWVMFTPTAPGIRLGAVILLDSNGNLLGTTLLSGTGSGGLAVLVPGNIITVAGVNRAWTSTKDGIPATTANLDQPASVALDGAGNLYIADTAHNRVRMVTAATGIISTIAGTGSVGYTGDNKAASAATLNTPSGVALDGAGNLYIADTGNNVVRKVALATESGSAGIITTVAGNGTAGLGGDGGLATAANLDQPLGVTLDISGNLYIADTANQRIREVDATGKITTVAGSGNVIASGGVPGSYGGDGAAANAANLNNPGAVAFDDLGNMYIPDSANNRIRMVKATAGVVTGSSIISTFAGTGTAGYTGDDAAANLAELNIPSSVAFDAAGNLYIADTQNSAIRKVASTSSSTPGVITTQVVNGIGYTLSLTDVLAPVNIYAPICLALDGNGDIFFADYFNMLVDEVESNVSVLSYTATPIRQGNQSNTLDQTVENDGNAPLDMTSITPDANALVDANVTTCTIDSPFLAVDADCIIGAIFAPAIAAGNTGRQYGNIDIADDTVSGLVAQNSPQDIELVGTVLAVNSTTITVTSNVNPSKFGQKVTFTATVTTGVSTGNLTGTVTFMDGATTLASNVALNSIGTTSTATYATSLLTVGTHSITAIYNNTNDPSHLSSTSAPLSQVVNEATAIILASSANPSLLGANVTFTATVTAPDGGGVPLDGNVVFTDTTTGTILGSPVLGASGVVTVSIATLTQGLHVITATYGGDANNYLLGAGPATVNQRVQASSSTSVTSSLNPSNYGVSVTFTVTVTPGGSGAPTGTVKIFDAGVLLGTATEVGTTNVWTYATTLLAVGSHSITAVYSGDNNNSTSTSPALIQIVNEVTAIGITSSLNPSAVGQNVTFTATVTAPSGGGAVFGGTVTFTDTTAGTVLGSPALGSNGIANVSTAALTNGVHIITATYAGYATNDILGSGPASLNQDVEAGSSTVVGSSGSPSIFGTPVTFTVTVTPSGGAAPTGTVNILDGGAKIGTATQAGTTNVWSYTTSSLTVGSHTITAVYSGDTNYAGSTSAAITQVVVTQTQTTLVAAPNPGIAGKPVTLTATVTVVAGATTTTGTVTFTDTTASGTVTLGTAPLGTGGTASISPTLAPGSHSIVVTYGGDQNDNGSASAALPLTVALATTQTVVASTPNPSIVQGTITFTATVTGTGGTPTESVNFLAGTTSMGTANLVASSTPGTATATITYSGLAAGSYQITASYAGDTNDSPSTSPAITQTVGTIPTVTDLGSATTTGSNPQVILVATVIGNSGPTPTGTITFNNGATTIGTATLDSNGIATLTPALAGGTYSLVAVYSGDALHSPSTSQPTTITVPAADFDLTVKPATISLAAGQNTTITVTLTSDGGFADTIGLGCGSLPAAVTCHFANTSASLAAKGTSTVQLTIDTNNPLSGGTVAVNTHPGNRGVSMAGLLAPLSVLFGFIFWRFRKRRALAMIAVLVLSSATLLVTGCGGVSQIKAAPGTYVIQINGVGANSDISRYQNVSLTITN